MIDAFTTPPVYVRKPMHDKPQAAPAHEFALPGHAVLALSGRDAVGFAQAQFMNDVTVLADGQWQWNGWLTPKAASSRCSRCSGSTRRRCGWCCCPRSMPRHWPRGCNASFSAAR